jgi:NADH dehydrogenase
LNKGRVALFGGSGFVGTVLANQLVREGFGLRIFTRDREHARALWLLPDTDIVALNVADEERVAHALEGCCAAVNLIGILHERRDDGADFRRAHVETAQHLAKACKQARVPHLLQMSALQAAPSAPSHYLRSRGEAEKILQTESGRQLHTTVLRASVIFGPHDDFLNRFAALLRLAPVLPLAGADALLQPVYVGDVVAAIVRLLSRVGGAAHSVFEIGGPAVMSLREIVTYVAHLSGHSALIVPLGGTLAGLLAWCMEWVPGKPLTRDNVRSLSVPSVCTAENGLVTLGIRPTPLQEIAPAYLSARTMRGRYDHYREDAVGVTREPGDPAPSD